MEPVTKREDLANEYLARGYWEGITVPQALDLAVEAYPELTALVCGSERVTYSEMRRRADSLAASFLEQGIGKGDIVTVQMPNWLEYIYVHYALARIGAITLPAIPLYRRREMSHILESYRSVGYVLPSHFGGFDYLKMLAEMRPSLPDLRHIFVAGEPVPPGASSIRAMLSERPSPGRVPDGLTHHTDVACLVVTGGTTGYPKGVPRTHNELLCHASNWARVMETTPQSTFLVPVPMTHVFGLVEGFYIPLTNGATLVLVDRFDPLEALRLIEQEKVTHALLVPAVIVSLLHYSGLDQFDTSSLRVIITGGGPCPEEAIHQAKTRLGCAVISQYGMSEGPLSTTILSDLPEVVSVTVGSPHCEGSEIKIVDEERRPVASGETGELAFRGPSLFQGYYEEPAYTAAAFDEEGWFYTGDLCLRDARGNLRIVGRKKDIIKRGGETVMPREIEELLYTHPKVLNAAVIGMPDTRLGERVCAYVVPNVGEEITLPEIVQFLKKKGLATFKLPERLEVVAELPITPPSKVQKNVLREDIVRKLKAEGKG